MTLSAGFCAHMGKVTKSVVLRLGNMPADAGVGHGNHPQVSGKMTEKRKCSKKALDIFTKKVYNRMVLEWYC